MITTKHMKSLTPAPLKFTNKLVSGWVWIDPNVFNEHNTIIF